jgi:hypothetical protein
VQIQYRFEEKKGCMMPFFSFIYLIAEKIGDDKEDKIRGFNYKEI